jgi:hypothetical protein
MKTEKKAKRYLFGDKYLFSILPNQQHARSDFCLIFYVVKYGRVGKYIMWKSKRYARSGRGRGRCLADDKLMLDMRVCGVAIEAVPPPQPDETCLLPPLPAQLAAMAMNERQTEMKGIIAARMENILFFFVFILASVFFTFYGERGGVEVGVKWKRCRAHEL